MMIDKGFRFKALILEYSMSENYFTCLEFQMMSEPKKKEAVNEKTI